jgi:hypothetical protein
MCDMEELLRLRLEGRLRHTLYITVPRYYLAAFSVQGINIITFGSSLSRALRKRRSFGLDSEIPSVDMLSCAPIQHVDTYVVHVYEF